MTTLPDPPLAGVRVLDVSGRIGAYASKLLADLGADVVLIEPPGGDPLRLAPPGRDGVADTGLLFAYYHGGKRSVVCDVADDANLEELGALGARADVVMVSPSPCERLTGFDADARTLTWARDDAVVCAITPFGLSGPFRSRRSTPFVSHAMSGDMHRIGPPEGPPVSAPGRLAWDEAGAHAAVAVLAALLARGEVGGQWIDLSVHDVLSAKDFFFEVYDVGGMTPGARVTRVGYPPTGTWQCADGWVDVAAHQVGHWEAFLETLGHPEQLAAPALHDAVVRRDVFDGLIDVIDEEFAGRRRDEVVERGQAAGLPCAPLNTPGQFVADPQLAARDFFVALHDDTLGELRLPGRPVATSAELFRPGRVAPRLGAHESFGDGSELDPLRLAKPLTNVRVLSFGAFIAGNTSALSLAELGADVVKLESRSRPEVLRMPAYAYGRVVEEPSGVTNTIVNAGLSRNARSLSLEMHTDEGRTIFRRLAASADVIVENFGSAEQMGRWDCSFEQLRELNPGVVMLSLSGYGRSGPRAGYRAYGTNISCFVGLTDVWGHTHGSLTDYLCSVHGVVGVLAGLCHMARTGEGVFIDAAQIETAAATMAPLLLDPLVNGREPELRPNVVPGSLLTSVVRCAGDDAWLAVELEDAADGAALCEYLERPELALVVAHDATARRELDGALAAWAARWSSHTAALLLQAHGLAAGAVQSIEDISRDPSLRTRGMVVEVTQPDLGVVEYAQSPYRLSVTPGQFRRPGARLGEHTREVLCEWLGLADADVDALADSGAVFCAPEGDP